MSLQVASCTLQSVDLFPRASEVHVGGPPMLISMLHAHDVCHLLRNSFLFYYNMSKEPINSIFY